MGTYNAAKTVIKPITSTCVAENKKI